MFRHAPSYPLRLWLLWNSRDEERMRTYAVDGTPGVDIIESSHWRAKEAFLHRLDKLARSEEADLSMECYDGDAQFLMGTERELAVAWVQFLLAERVFGVNVWFPGERLSFLSRETYSGHGMDGILSRWFAVIRVEGKPLASLHFLMDDSFPFLDLYVMTLDGSQIMLSYSLIGRGEDLLSQTGLAGKEILSEADRLEEGTFIKYRDQPP